MSEPEANVKLDELADVFHIEWRVTFDKNTSRRTISQTVKKVSDLIEGALINERTGEYRYHVIDVAVEAKGFKVDADGRPVLMIEQDGTVSRIMRDDEPAPQPETSKDDDHPSYIG